MQNKRYQLSQQLDMLRGNTEFRKRFDRLVVALGVLNAIATLPQLISIISQRSAGGLSMISWGYYSLFSLVLLIYGILLREKPAMITYGLNLFLYVGILASIIIYS